MPNWIPRSVFAIVLASIYLVFAIVILISERNSEGGGGWISLKGMGTFLMTFPVSAVGELLGIKPDFRRNADMIFTISTCTVLVYFVGAGLGKLARLVFSDGGTT